MCGLTGLLALNGSLPYDAREWCQAMGRAIAHRGPDADSVWLDAPQGIALGHRRLAVVELSEQGAQPMRSACDRYVIAFNGEIYNHLALRAELPRQSWRGGSDTETMLACFSHWGVVAALPRLTGMFALAVWDRQSHSVTLARDRMGEKPLAYATLQGKHGLHFVFASDLSALRQHPHWQQGINRDALASYMRHSCVPAPQTIHEGVHKLAPGHWMTVQANGQTQQGAWYSVNALAASTRPQREHPMSDADALAALNTTLGDAVSSQMMADVPLGAFLSGGVDSSTIVALMQSRSAAPVRTFTMGFDVPGFNEAEQAQAVAKHLGTDHTTCIVTARDALDVVPKLAAMYDEPFADSSQIPTYLVARMARQHVTVALSGDGADELFGGYNRYMVAQRWWPRVSHWPQPLRQALANNILNTSAARWDARYASVSQRVPRLRGYSAVGLKLHKAAAGVLAAASVADMHRKLVSAWHDPQALVLGSTEPADRAWPLDGLDAAQAMALMDQTGYMPDDILVKVDRASMQVSLETRAPFLDHRVVDLSWRLSPSQKIRGRRSKWLLRQLLNQYVPAALIDRPKQGFAVPVADWLRGPLKDWGGDLLNHARLTNQGLLNASLVQKRWDEHQRGTRDHHAALWAVLMFQNWLEAQSLGPSLRDA
jgi:asparagine synthase (glutamine-hydrolysing)